jgi:hypothetical protein
MQDYFRSSTSMLIIHEIIKQPVWGNMVVKVQELQQTCLLFWALSTVLSVFITGTNLDTRLQKQLQPQTLYLKNSRRCTTSKISYIYCSISSSEHLDSAVKAFYGLSNAESPAPVVMGMTEV